MIEYPIMSEKGNPVNPLEVEALLRSTKEKEERLDLAGRMALLSASLYCNLTSKAFTLLTTDQFASSIQLREASLPKKRSQSGKVCLISYPGILSVHQEGQEISLPLSIEFLSRPSFLVSSVLTLKAGDRQQGQAVYVIYPPEREKVAGKEVSLGTYSFWQGHKQVVEEKPWREISKEEYGLLKWITMGIAPEILSPSPETPQGTKI